MSEILEAIGGRIVRDLKHVTCPQCKKDFRLSWDATTLGNPVPQTLVVRWCPSGGVYDVSIECPHCDYVEEL